ncbi:unnamed protein product [Schistosoma mattheei]|uniref:Uncharacterized protein n=1 Tax=Schistosoma mattheei TaxID=31246 RepID=A0A3P8G434_9TREM|nr:unnamed protein product [Schistosoma mattheei]
MKNPSKVSLLVLDPESKAYFENNSINVSKFMVDIEKVYCPAVNPFTSGQKVNGHNELVSKTFCNLVFKKIIFSSFKTIFHY